MLPIIIDTDIGPDCDDVGALAVAASFVKRGQVALRCVTCCNSTPYAPRMARLVLDSFDLRDVPVGQLSGKTLFEEPDRIYYNKPVTEAYGAAETNFADAVQLLRETLYQSEERVTIVTIGTLTNVASLLQTQPTADIPLSGWELLAQKAERLICMAGTFTEGFPEFNVEQDIASAQAVLASFPREVVFQPFEVGMRVLTGAPLLASGVKSPAEMAYRLYLAVTGQKARESWDLTTVYFALCPECSHFQMSGAGRIEIDDKGYTTFIEDSSGPHHICTLAEGGAEGLQKELDDILLRVHSA